MLRRKPKENPKLFEALRKEYTFLGFFEAGGEVRQRSPQEQEEFAVHARQEGLRVVAPLRRILEVTYVPFLEHAQTLDDSLPMQDEGQTKELLRQLFSDLATAHGKKIVYGDRWSKNVLIDDKEGIAHIDFDLELDGEVAKVFELAQITYYVLCAIDQARIPILADCIKKHSAQDYDPTLFAQFVRRHASYFQASARYAAPPEAVEALLGLL